MDAQRSCHDKRRYWTKTDAQLKANKCTKKRGTALRVYFCELCLGYHLTKQVDRKAA